MSAAVKPVPGRPWSACVCDRYSRLCPHRARVSRRLHALGRPRDRPVPHRAARRPHRRRAHRRRPRARAAHRVRPGDERSGRRVRRGRPGRHRAVLDLGRGTSPPETRARPSVRVRVDPSRRRRHVVDPRRRCRDEGCDGDGDARRAPLARRTRRQRARHRGLGAAHRRRAAAARAASHRRRRRRRPGHRDDLAHPARVRGRGG